MYRLRSHPEADLELENIIHYLNENTLWEATRFAVLFQSALQKIRQHPECTHFVWKEYRRYNLPRFPYALIYRHRDNEIYLVAVTHEKRHPDYWKERIRDDRE